MNDSPSSTDLERLSQEILTKEPEAALPSRLSDYWLQRVASDLESLDQLGTEKSDIDPSRRLSSEASD